MHNKQERKDIAIILRYIYIIVLYLSQNYNLTSFELQNITIEINVNKALIIIYYH